MKTASAAEIRQSLKALDKKELTEICLRLSRYKKENKELLTFLLFEADDLPHYIAGAKEELDDVFVSVNQNNLHLAKKGLRKALRVSNRYVRYAADKTVEVEVLLHFCTNFKGLRVDWQRSNVLVRMYHNQLKKIDTALNTMHQDLEHDYRRSLERLK